MIVGVIGGAGVAATNKLLELIEVRKTTEGAFRDIHHPEMIVYQATQAPSRSMFLEGKGPSFIEDYISIGNKLKNSGADVLCMCCNTAHYALPILQDAIKIPFINVIEEVAKTCKLTGKLRFGLVASDGCRKGLVYENAFKAIFPNAQFIYPDDSVQKQITKGICNIKNTHRFDAPESEERPSYIFENVYNHLMSKGAEIVITGCTDIRVDYKSSHENVVDSLEVLANKIVELSK
ncbi:MAG: aspartate/glutamate racemase family protein [Bacteroidales bacterium]|nr:aspartate/glutamate racemase family protein [Bacteroidales bacterium]